MKKKSLLIVLVAAFMTSYSTFSAAGPKDVDSEKSTIFIEDESYPVNENFTFPVLLQDADGNAVTDDISEDNFIVAIQQDGEDLPDLEYELTFQSGGKPIDTGECFITISFSDPGKKTVSVTLKDLDDNTEVPIGTDEVWIYNDVDSTNSKFFIDKETISVDETVLMTITLLDSDGFPIQHFPGNKIKIMPDSDPDLKRTLKSDPPFSDSEGKIEFEISSVKTAEKIITVQVSEETISPQEGFTVDFTHGVTSAAASLVEPTKTHFIVGAVAEFTLTLKDQHGNTVPDSTLVNVDVGLYNAADQNDVDVINNVNKKYESDSQAITIEYSCEKSGEKVLQVTVDGMLLTIQPTISVLAGDPVKMESDWPVNELTIDETLPFRVVLRDSFDNPVLDVSKSDFSVTMKNVPGQNGGDSNDVNNLEFTLEVSDGNIIGEHVLQIINTEVGEKFIFVKHQDIEVSALEQINFKHGSISAKDSFLSPLTRTFSVGDSVELSINLFDKGINPIPDISASNFIVALYDYNAADSNAVNYIDSLVKLDERTGPDGIMNFMVTTKKDGEKKFVITVDNGENPVELSSQKITFNPGSIDPNESKVFAVNEIVSVDDKVKLTITFVDKYLNARSGVRYDKIKIYVSNDADSNSVVPLKLSDDDFRPPITQDDGITEVAAEIKETGDKVFTVVVEENDLEIELSTRPIVTFIHGKVVKGETIVTSDDEAQVGEKADVTLELKDQHGNPVTEELSNNFDVDVIDVSSAETDSVAYNTFTFDKNKPDIFGVMRASFTSQSIGEKTIRISVNDVQLSEVTTMFMPGTVSSDSSSITLLRDASTINKFLNAVITLRDKFGNPINGIQSDDISIDINAADSNELVKFTDLETSPDGTINTSFTYNRKIDSAFVVVAVDVDTSDPVEITSINPVWFRNKVYPNNSYVSVDKRTTSVDDKVVFKFLLHDNEGEPIRKVYYDEIIFDLNGNGLIYSTELSQFSDVNGEIQFEVNYTKTDSPIISVMADSVPLINIPNLTFTPGIANADSSMCHIIKDTGIAGAEKLVDLAKLIITLRDQYGNFIENEDLENFKFYIGETKIKSFTESGVLRTDSDGEIVFYLTYPTQGDKSLRVILSNGAELYADKTITFTPDYVSSQFSTIQIEQEIKVGIGNVIAELLLYDKNENPLSGITVDSIKISDADSNDIGNIEKFSNPEPSGPQGELNVTFSNTVAGNKMFIVTVIDRGDTLSLTSDTVTFIHDAISDSVSFISTDVLVRSTDDNSKIVATVTVNDRFGNPINDAEVIFEPFPSIGSVRPEIEPQVKNTNSSGIVTAEISSGAPYNTDLSDSTAIITVQASEEGGDAVSFSMNDSIAFVDDTEGPVIKFTHNENKNPNPSDGKYEVKITADDTYNTIKEDAVKLYYWYPGENEDQNDFFTMDLSEDGTEFSYTFDSAIVKVGTRYKVTANDAADIPNQGWSETWTIPILLDSLKVDNTDDSPWSKNGLINNKWTLFSVPGVVDGSLTDSDNLMDYLSSWFGGDPDSTSTAFWNYGIWNTQTRRYDQSKKLEPGKSFFLIQRRNAIAESNSDGDEVKLSFPNGHTVQNKSSFIYLYNGWNFIGNIYPYEVEFQELIPSYYVDQKSQFWAYSYDVASQDWDIARNGQKAMETIVKPWQGIVVKYSKSQQTTEKPENKTLKKASTISWSARISAFADRYQDTHNYFGVSSSSHNISKAPEPPQVGNYGSLYFEDQQPGITPQRYCMDYREENESGHIWDINFASHGRKEKILLQFDLENAPDKIHFALIDMTMGRKKRLYEDTKYEFTTFAKSYLHTFKLVSGSENYVNNKTTDILATLPQEFVIYQNFPNPFNPTTTIVYSLPYAAPVTLDIYNIMGQKVVRLLDKDIKTPGNHSISWNATDAIGKPVAAGIYIYKIKMGTFIESQKMTVIK